MHPTPLRSASTEEPQVQNPRRRGRLRTHNSHWCGAVRLRGRASGIEPGVATNRRGPRSRKRSWTRPQQGVLASDTCRVFGTTPATTIRPGWGIFVPQRSFRLRLRRSMDRFTSSFVAPAGTKCGPASRCSKQSRSGTKARAGPASVETSGLSQKDSSHNWSPMMPGTNPLRDPQSERIKVVRSGSPPPYYTEVSCVGTQ